MNIAFYCIGWLSMLRSPRIFLRGIAVEATGGSLGRRASNFGTLWEAGSLRVDLACEDEIVIGGYSTYKIIAQKYTLASIGRQLLTISKEVDTIVRFVRIR
jgi:hypothetical protein